MDNEETVFSYEGYQVVRGEYFAHLAEPSVVFNRYKVYVNTACLRKAADTNFVQILINPDERKLVVRPCREDEKDAFAWCTAKRKVRQITCRMFFAKIADLMNWNPDYRYKLLGKMILSHGERLFVFELTSAVLFPRAAKAAEADSEQAAISRGPVYPEAWKKQFGLPVEEHRRAFQISLFDGYAVFGVRNSAAKASKERSGETNDGAERIVSPNDFN